jgi:endonuclease YncB( thermonuclease family)
MPRTLLLLVGILALPFFQVQASKWERLKNCLLVENEYNDGDSFRVSHKGREYIFRLYCADAPEADNSYAERVAEQAAHFGITSEEAIEIGKDAKSAVEDLLEKPFDVVTRWQDGGGWSKMGRSYAFILIDGKDGPKTADLAGVLIARGLARAHGAKVNPPDSDLTASELAETYREIESEARRKKKGAWK